MCKYRDNALLLLLLLPLPLATAITIIKLSNYYYVISNHYPLENSWIFSDPLPFSMFGPPANNEISKTMGYVAWPRSGESDPKNGWWVYGKSWEPIQSDWTLQRLDLLKVLRCRCSCILTVRISLWLIHLGKCCHGEDRISLGKRLKHLPKNSW